MTAYLACCCEEDSTACDCADNDTTTGVIKVEVARRHETDSVGYFCNTRSVRNRQQNGHLRITRYLQSDIQVRCSGYSTFLEDGPTEVQASYLANRNEIRTASLVCRQNPGAEFYNDQASQSGYDTKTIENHIASSRLNGAQSFSWPTRVGELYEEQYGAPFEINPDSWYRTTRVKLSVSVPANWSGSTYFEQAGEVIQDTSYNVPGNSAANIELFTYCELPTCDVTNFGNRIFDVWYGSQFGPEDYQPMERISSSSGGQSCGDTYPPNGYCSDSYTSPPTPIGHEFRRDIVQGGIVGFNTT